jgi:hypothetical protein
MSRFFFFCLLLSSLFLTSCGGDDDDAVTDNDIVGSWMLTSSVTGSQSAAPGYNSRLTLVYKSGDVELQFKDDGTYESSGAANYAYSQTDLTTGDTLLVYDNPVNHAGTGTYTAVNGTLDGYGSSTSPQNLPGVSISEVYTYTLSGDNLTIEVSGTALSGGINSDLFGTVTYRRL